VSAGGVAIWAYSELETAANETAFVANELANATGGTATVIEVDKPRTGVAAARKLVLRAPGPIGDSPQLVAGAIHAAAQARAGGAAPSLVVVGGTRKGKETAARLAVKLNSGCMSDVFGLTLSETGDELRGSRNIYAGKFLASVACRLPAIASLKTGMTALPETSGSQAGAVEVFDVGELASKVKVLSKNPKPASRVDLRGAKVIVSAGRGVKKKEDLSLVEGLAGALGGVLGCSRPISSDLGWLPEEHHIGLTGLAVHPDLYLAVGISGQLQHIAGIKDSKVIASINTDKDAPIFQASDYGVVGDLYKVIPELRKLLGSAGSAR